MTDVSCIAQVMGKKHKFFRLSVFFPLRHSFLAFYISECRQNMKCPLIKAFNVSHKVAIYTSGVQFILRKETKSLDRHLMNASNPKVREN